MENQRIADLQALMKTEHLDAYYLNTNDYHISEYVPEYFKTIAYFSGFTGSLATLIIELKKAYIFVDGRYHIQADKQCLPNDVEVIKLGTRGAMDPLAFIEQNYKGKSIGIDGKRTTVAFGKSLEKICKIKQIDIYSKLIKERVPLKEDLIFEHDIKYAGRTRKQKISDLLYCLNGKTHIINNLECIAYLLNLRAHDVAYNPVFLAYVVIYQNELYLFADVKRFSEETLDRLYDDGVIIRPYASYYDFLKEIKKEIILLDENKVNYETYSLISRNNHTINYFSPIEEMKAIKNETEIKNARKAHIYDGVSMVRFLKWLSEQNKNELNEYIVSEKLKDFRLSYKADDLSFGTIVAYNANAAMMHYAPTEAENAALHNNGILLIDSGGQYYEGTTDITRTIALGEVSDIIKKHYSIVLKSMFNLSSLKFLSGMSGKDIDIVARRDIFDLGLDYRCGTGHGIGSYLAVHETFPNVRYMNTEVGGEKMPLKPGYTFSDEPGIYLENEYGIRLENMLLCKEAEQNEYGQFLDFETLTLCPFDLNLIDKKYLDEVTVKRLNAYHHDVYEKLSPYLNDEEKAYLEETTREI